MNVSDALSIIGASPYAERELNALGFVILPIIPSDETLKAMGNAMSEDDPLIFEMLSDRELDQSSRAAYGAAVHMARAASGVTP